MTQILRGYEVWLVGHEQYTSCLNHRNASKAKYEYLLSVSDAFCGDLPWALVRCRSLVAPVPDPGLMRIAESRGQAAFVVGDRVSLANKLGVVAGAAGGYVSVLFDDCQHTLPCHPGELVTVVKELP